MVLTKAIIGGSDALVIDSYQAKTGKVRATQPQAARESVLPTDPPLRKTLSVHPDCDGRAAVSALPLHSSEPGAFGQELGADRLDHRCQPAGELWGRACQDCG